MSVSQGNPGPSTEQRQRRTVLIRGVGGHNGGAELMMLSAARWASSQGLVSFVDYRSTSSNARRKWKLGAYVDFPRLRVLRGLGVSLLPAALRRRLGVATSRDVDVVLDASGYWLGDGWNGSWAEEVAGDFQRWTDRGVPVVLLPQALGPFTKDDSRRGGKDVLRSASLVFARDRDSLQYAEDLTRGQGNIKLAPDFSAQLKPDAASKAQIRTVAVVPNANIPKRLGLPVVAYAESLAELCKLIANDGYHPVLLVHSSDGDPEIARLVVELVPDVEQVQPQDGLAAKAYLAGCEGVIGARYHALASALSMGVPVVAHSWSHKYQALLEDFSWPGQMADPMDAAGSYALLAGVIGDDDARQRLRAAAAHVVSENGRMWRAVESHVAQFGSR